MSFIVNIDVPDIGEAVAFYENGLGLRLGRWLFEGTVAEMSGGAAPLYLLEKLAGSDAVPGASIRRDYRRHWTPVHLDFMVTDLDAAVARVIDAGGGLEGTPRSFAWGGLATMHDPFGNGFCLIEFRAGGYGEVRDGKSEGGFGSACREA